MLTITTLASGSSGTAALVASGATHILLDGGISARRIVTGLRALGVEPDQLRAILVTHEHHDHISGLPVFTKKRNIPIVATQATCRCLAEKAPNLASLLRVQEAGTGVQVGELWVESFSTPHDAADSVGYAISGDGGRMVLCTDLGYVTPQVREAVRGCDLLVCETNYDEDWLRSGPYPYSLKQRVMGDRGHLSNEAGAELAAMAVESGTRTVILAHLSQENNTPTHARSVVCRRLAAMGCDPERDIYLEVAPRNELGTSFRLEKDRDRSAFSGKGAAVC